MQTILLYTALKLNAIETKQYPVYASATIIPLIPRRVDQSFDNE